MLAFPCRTTLRAYLNGERTPGQRRQAPDAFVPFLPYCRQRLADDPHLWASTLFDEVTALGYQGAYSTFTRALRRNARDDETLPEHTLLTELVGLFLQVSDLHEVQTLSPA
ncbi:MULTISPECIES: hypothetical protein [Streptomyces]|uniref:Transposase n=2 Tax=Streptomyces TaxID=1883 RepID=A0ABV9J7Q8_9ACTN